MTQTIGIFGGTFSPFHNGHLRALKLFSQKYAFDKIFVIPTGIPPHKNREEGTSDEDRLAMARIAALAVPQAEACGYEIQKGGKSYTAKTLAHFREVYPDARLVLYTGSDMFLTIQDWYAPEQIFAPAQISVFSRTGNDLPQLKAHSAFLAERYGAKSTVFCDEPFPLSASEIRQKLARGEDCSALLPEKVYDYIKRKNLYRKENKDGI